MQPFTLTAFDNSFISQVSYFAEKAPNIEIEYFNDRYPSDMFTTVAMYDDVTAEYYDKLDKLLKKLKIESMSPVITFTFTVVPDEQKIIVHWDETDILYNDRFDSYGIGAIDLSEHFFNYF